MGSGGTADTLASVVDETLLHLTSGRDSAEQRHDALVEELRWLLQRLRSGRIPRAVRLRVLYLSGGPVDDRATRDGWHPRFVELADAVHATLAPNSAD
jgi:hypothetical protein